MSRRVSQRTEKGKQILPCYPENEDDLCWHWDNRNHNELVDWTLLPYDTVIQLFSCLNYRDRASLSSTCRTWRALGASPCLWQSLDLRAHNYDVNAADSISSRCSSLQKLRFRGADSADAIINLRATNLKEIWGDGCGKIVDSTLSVIVARHEALQSLQLGPEFCEKISSDAIKAIAKCCPKLRKLRLSGLREVNADALNGLANHCKDLVDVGFIDCLSLDEVALGCITSIRFLSVAGTSGMDRSAVSEHWIKLPNLIGLDVSRTLISPTSASRLLSCSKSLKVLCALNCSAIEEDVNFAPNIKKGALLLTLSSDIFKAIASLFGNALNKDRDVFSYWRSSMDMDKTVDDIMTWVEWVMSHSLLRIAESNSQGLDHFWINQGVALLLTFLESSQDDVKERAATGLANFVITDDENGNIDGRRAEAVLSGGGISLLLNLARSWRDGFQSEAAKAIANLSVRPSVAKAVADQGGISILSSMVRSTNKMVAEEAAGGLWNLSVGEEHKGVIAETGGIEALVGLIFKWHSGGDGVLERAAGALANLAADDQCSIEIAEVDGVHALVMLARNCKTEGVQEQAARALANMAAHGDTNHNNATVGLEAGSIEALVQLTRSPHEGVRQEAAGALWNLSFDDRNRESISTAGGIEALVALANSCSNSSPSLQERAAGALWGLSVSEANSIAIGQEGGVAPLIRLARSETEDVHETAAGALWNLAFNSSNALRIVEEDGVPTLVHLCSSSGSTMARFMAALALAYMFDQRMGAQPSVGSSSDNIFKSANLDGSRRTALKHIEAFVLSFVNPSLFSTVSASSPPSALARITESVRIIEAGHLRCSGCEIGRFVTMLRNPSSVLKACAAFALLQFTIPGGRHAIHHVNLLQNAGASRILRGAAASANASLEAKIFAKIVLRNIEHHSSL